MIAANRKPINVACRKILAELKLPADPEQLYLHQVLMNALEQENNGLTSRSQVVFLRDLLEKIDARAPEELLDWMSVPEGSVDPAELDDLEPDEAGQVLIQILHQETAEKVETYP